MTTGGPALDVKAAMPRTAVANVSLFIVVVFMVSIELGACRHENWRFLLKKPPG
jgi:hypothetical protein